MQGWAYLAAKSGAQVLPVAIRGSRNVLPVGSFILRRGRITLNIGDVMIFSGQGKVSRENMGEMNEKLDKEFRQLFNAQFNGRIFNGASKSI
jgi:1-acyl-sn-glycerol-3-phosphate acyltransferase